jgi:hypothetical protein
MTARSATQGARAEHGRSDEVDAWLAALPTRKLKGRRRPHD